MKAVVQRVSKADVKVENKNIGSIHQGLMVLLGVAQGDTTADADYLGDKIINLRIFEDDQGKMNRSLVETGGELLIVSQFTLLGDCKKGRRPSFVNAAPPETAEKLYEYLVFKIREKGIPTKTGKFRAMMDVSLINNGPVTILLDSRA